MYPYLWLNICINDVVCKACGDAVIDVDGQLYRIGGHQDGNDVYRSFRDIGAALGLSTAKLDSKKSAPVDAHVASKHSFNLHYYPLVCLLLLLCKKL